MGWLQSARCRRNLLLACLRVRRGICNAQGCSGLARIRAFLRLRDGLRTGPQGSSPSSVPVYGPLYKAQRLPAPLGSSSCCEWATVCACTQAPG